MHRLCNGTVELVGLKNPGSALPLKPIKNHTYTTIKNEPPGKMAKSRPNRSILMSDGCIRGNTN